MFSYIILEIVNVWNCLPFESAYDYDSNAIKIVSSILI